LLCSGAHRRPHLAVLSDTARILAAVKSHSPCWYVKSNCSPRHTALPVVAAVSGLPRSAGPHLRCQRCKAHHHRADQARLQTRCSRWLYPATLHFIFVTLWSIADNVQSALVDVVVRFLFVRQVTRCKCCRKQICRCRKHAKMGPLRHASVCSSAASLLTQFRPHFSVMLRIHPGCNELGDLKSADRHSAEADCLRRQHSWYNVPLSPLFRNAEAQIAKEQSVLDAREQDRRYSSVSGLSSSVPACRAVDSHPCHPSAVLRTLLHERLVMCLVRPPEDTSG
jgi:hypothetical protein